MTENQSVQPSILRNDKIEMASCVKFLKSHKVEVESRDIIEIEKIDYDLRTALIAFLPENALDEVVAMLQKYSIHLWIVARINGGKYPYRMFKYGDCSNPHIICIKKDLDKDWFLYIFLHEYALLLNKMTFLKSPYLNHEFYFCLNELICDFVKKNILSKDCLSLCLKELKYYYFSLYQQLNGEDKDWEPCEYQEKIRQFVPSEFILKKFKIGSQFKYKGEIFVRGKRQQCSKLLDGTIFRLKLDTLVEPVLDLCW